MLRSTRALAALSLALSVPACEPRADAPTPGFVRLDDAVGMALRYVPAGRLLVGSPEGETGRDDDERLHPVELTRGFWAMETEVTQGLWLEVMGSNPALFVACGPSCPVERVSWYDSVAFANRLSERAGLEACYRLVDCRGTPGSGCPEGLDWCEGDFVCSSVELTGPECSGYRLPTEAEWEHLARAGTEGPTWRGPFEIAGLNSAPALDPIAWYGGNSGVDYEPAWDCGGWKEKQIPAERCGTHPVGGKAPNPWGLADTLGNVWEWVWDGYGPYPEGSVTDPMGPAAGDDRIRRGCSWANIPRHCRAADRSADPPGVRDRNWGVRLVRTDLLR